MNGIHDLGGMHGFGPVDPTDDEPFHEDWEKWIFGISRTLPVHRLYTLDELRFIREQIEPKTYLNSGYWEQRLIMIERKLLDLDILSPGEIDERMEMIDQIHIESPESNRDLVSEVNEMISSTRTFDREPKPQQFGVGDRVIARNIHPEGHTRLPRYVRRANGEVITYHGTHMFPDTAAEGNTDVSEPLYSVRFESRELWGDESQNPDTVVLQLFEPYLESVPD